MVMAEKMNIKRLEELKESDYLELENVYSRLRDMKAAVAQMHDEYVGQGTPPAFDRVEAVYILLDELFADFERYFLPEADASSAFEPVRDEE